MGVAGTRLGPGVRVQENSRAGTWDVSWEVGPRTFHKLGLVFVVLWMALGAGVRFGLAAESRTGVSVVKHQDGYTITAPGYQASVGLDGNLHSFRIGDVEMLDDRVGIRWAPSSTLPRR